MDTFRRGATRTERTGESSARPHRVHLIVPHSFRDALKTLADRSSDDATLFRLSREAAGLCIDRVRTLNPYLEIDAGGRSELVKIYQKTAVAILAGAVPTDRLVRVHFPALREWIVRFYPVRMRSALSEGPLQLGRVTCTEYSPRLQLDVLGIDIGCGRDGRLVTLLGERGIDARGIDRAAREDVPSVESADWLDLDFGTSRYGRGFCDTGRTDLAVID